MTIHTGTFAYPAPPGASTYRVCYMTTVEGRIYYKNMTFASETDHSRWVVKSDEIKHVIAAINSDDIGNPPHAPETETRLRAWTHLVAAFAADFGNNNVPLDITYAVNNVQEYLSLPVTDFGPDNGTLDHPNSAFPDAP